MRGRLRGAPDHHGSAQEHAAKQAVYETDDAGKSGRTGEGKLHADHHADGKLGAEDRQHERERKPAAWLRPSIARRSQPLQSVLTNPGKVF